MKIELVRADIIILASAHNSSMVTAKWLRDKNLITEEPTQTLFTPISSLFESETFSLIVTPDRLQITAKKDNIEALKSLVKIGEEYIRLSPYIAYRALGLNFIWITRILEGGEELPKINVNISSLNSLSSVFTNHELNYGGIIYAKKDPYLLKLMIELQEKSALIYNFNHHHEIQGLDIDKIASYLGNFINLYENSKTIVNTLFTGEIKT